MIMRTLHCHRNQLLMVAFVVTPAMQAQLQLRWSDEFVPREAPGYINGGIDTSIWNLHIGDGADYGVPGG